MKIGMCAPIDKAATVAAMGFDYLEPPTFSIAALDEGAFSALVEQVHALPAEVEDQVHIESSEMPLRLRQPPADLGSGAIMVVTADRGEQAVVEALDPDG